VLSSLQGQSLKRWSEKVAILPRQQRLIPARVSQDIHETLTRALLHEKQIDEVYQPRGRDPKDYVLYPLGLVIRGSASYLVASANAHDDPIHFALHRFHSAEVSTRPARMPPGFSLEQHLHSQVFDYPLQDDMIQLVALFDADRAQHLHETPLSEDQGLEAQPDGREKLIAQVRDTQELRWWLLGFGDGVEILEPKALRDEFAAMAARMHRQYSAN